MKNRCVGRSRRVALAVVAVLAFVHCDRGIEPFDPAEEPRQPDLSRIFPEGAKAKGMRAEVASEAAARDGGRGTAPMMAARVPKPAPAKGTAGPDISGFVRIAESVAGSRPPGGVLFIVARSGGPGPPLAVLRVQSPVFPHEFEIGQANVMMPGLVFEGEIQLSARLDSDGNAMTKLPGDLTGEIANTLGPGAQGVALILDQRI
jgi:hypothetical protein